MVYRIRSLNAMIVDIQLENLLTMAFGYKAVDMEVVIVRN